jgi:hypothetical protein
MAMRTELLRFNGAVERAPAIDAWMREHAGELGGSRRVDANGRLTALSEHPGSSESH